MPVEDVELGEGHGLDESLDGCHSKEVPGRVDHDTSVLQQGSVTHSNEGNAVLLDYLRKRLQGIDVSRVISKADDYTFRRDPDLIGLRLEVESGSGGKRSMDVLVKSEGAVAIGVGIGSLEYLAEVVL